MNITLSRIVALFDRLNHVELSAHTRQRAAARLRQANRLLAYAEAMRDRIRKILNGAERESAPREGEQVTAAAMFRQ